MEEGDPVDVCICAAQSLIGASPTEWMRDGIRQASCQLLTPISKGLRN